MGKPARSGDKGDSSACWGQIVITLATPPDGRRTIDVRHTGEVDQGDLAWAGGLLLRFASKVVKN